MASYSSIIHPFQPNMPSCKPIDRLCPTQVPLPPSPPPSDALNIEPLEKEDGRGQERSTRLRSKRVLSNSTSKSRSAGPHELGPIPRKNKRPRQLSPIQDNPFEDHSPPTSPTTRKAFRQPKRVKTSTVPKPGGSYDEQRDSPNNPFLVRGDEPPRHPGAKQDEKNRKLVYVFRGKRVQFDTQDDLEHCGESPFTLSGPRLLFPSAPEVKVCRSLEEEEEEEEEGLAEGSASVPKKVDRTPKKEISCPTQGLPTPQSRPRGHRAKTRHPYRHGHRIGPLVHTAQGSSHMSKAMR